MFGLSKNKEICYVCMKKAKLDTIGVCEDCNKNNTIEAESVDPGARLHISGEFFALYGKGLLELESPIISAYRSFDSMYTPIQEKEAYYQEALRALNDFKQFYYSKGIAGRVAWYENLKRLDPDAAKSSLSYTLYHLLRDEK